MRVVVTGAIALSLAGAAAAQYVENFDDPFSGWTQRWFYQNTNAGNYYVATGNCDENYRGNNPQGLWIVDTQVCGGGVGGNTVDIYFNPAFAATLNSLQFGVEAWVKCDIKIYDLANNVVGSLIGVSGGGYDFDHKDIVTAVSNNGIRRIEFNSNPYGGGQIEGNTSVDNITAGIVPAPGVAALLGLGALTAGRRRRP